ncbi:MAG: adenylate/guanylate cyclase domain-containing protein [Parvularculaceae bacterium]|nr:adenylate/guanylate cyclase domain-containing protein [Parvularculaceae bacterium]
MTTLERAPPSTSRRNISEAIAASLRSLAAPPTAPARIRAAVEAYETESERIISWVQLAGVGVFAALYVATYAAFEVHPTFEPVPVVLLFYSGFTLWRLRPTREGTLSTRQQYASAALDIFLLTALIGAFPRQYGEPAALYLKAPTLFYVYILIALRALRFDPRLVLFTGVAAALGWALLTAIAALDGAPTTGDYRVYMTSLALLPGAELEKIAGILATTGVLALGVDRARALLFRTATEEAATADLSKFVGRDAAERIRASDEGVKAGDGEIRRAAIMFVDLRGFTPATRTMPPRDVIALLQEYHSRLLPLIERGGGSVDKFLGDGILVSFGAARESGRECADAVETAFAVDAEALRWRDERLRTGKPPLDVGIALASGDVVYGAVGHGDRLEYTVIGEPVNLAAKLEKRAKAENARIIATKGVVKDAGDQGFPAAPLRRIAGGKVEGVLEPVDFEVLA